jgi:biotin transport system substrate-specific component
MKNLKKIITAVIFSAFIAIGAFISVPLPVIRVPFSLQIFFVFLVSLVLEKKYALLSVAVYLLAGATGMPVFANMTGGISHFFTPSGGFLIGFLFIPISFYVFKDEKKALFLGIVLLYTLGISWFSYILKKDFITSLKILSVFIPLDIIKAVFAYFISKKIKKAVANG